MEQFLTSLAPSVEASFLSGTADCGEGEATHLIRLRRESQKSMIKTCFEGLIHFENVLLGGFSRRIGGWEANALRIAWRK